MTGCRGGPGAEGVHDRVEALEVVGGQVEQILDDGVLGGGLVLAAHDGGDVEAAIDGFLDDELAGLAVCCNNCGGGHWCSLLFVGSSPIRGALPVGRPRCEACQYLFEPLFLFDTIDYSAYSYKKKPSKGKCLGY